MRAQRTTLASVTWGPRTKKPATMAATMTPGTIHCARRPPAAWRRAPGRGGSRRRDAAPEWIASRRFAIPGTWPAPTTASTRDPGAAYTRDARYSSRSSISTVLTDRQERGQLLEHALQGALVLEPLDLLMIELLAREDRGEQRRDHLVLAPEARAAPGALERDLDVAVAQGVGDARPRPPRPSRRSSPRRAARPRSRPRRRWNAARAICAASRKPLPWRSTCTRSRLRQRSPSVSER